MGRLKKIAPTPSKKKKSTVEAGPQATQPPQLRSTREFPCLWLKGENLPPQWENFRTRDIVYERQFNLDNIINNSEEGELQLANGADFLDSRDFFAYTDLSTDRAYPSLARLFYASLAPTESEDVLKGSIGKFQFEVTRDDLVILFDCPAALVAEAPNLNSEEFRKNIPSIPQLIQDLFIVPNGRRHALVSHLDIYLTMVLDSNIYPAKGNKDKLTPEMLELLWILKHHKPCLVHVIFDTMRGVLTKPKNVALPFPSLIVDILQFKGYEFPETHEAAKLISVIDAAYWDLACRSGYLCRLAAFQTRGWTETVGMIVGGTPKRSNTSDPTSKKRKVPQSSIAPDTDTPSTSQSVDLSALITSLTSIIDAQFDRMQTHFDQRFEHVESKVDSLAVKVDSLAVDIQATRADVIELRLRDEQDADSDVIYA